MNLKKLLIRSLSGLVYVGLIAGCLLWGLLPFACLGAAMAAIATVEFAHICHDDKSGLLPTLILDVLGCVFLAFGVYVFPLALWLATWICRMVMEIYTHSDRPLHDMSHSMMSQLYIGLPIGVMVALGPWFGSLHTVLAIFLMIWINDTGAFLVGSLTGRYRMIERISPKKTWEGFAGGLAFNLVAGALMCIYGSDFFDIHFNLWLWLGLGALVTVFATWGDLVESMIKRNLHIKDSGKLIPGHGGILDRIDSLLLVMPASLVYFLMIDLCRIAP